MRVVLSKHKLYTFLFTICVAVTYLNNFELTYSVWFLTALFTFSHKFSVTFIKQILCFSAILIIGIVVMFSYEYKKYFIIRDFTYMSKPIIGLLLGYQLFKYNHKKTFRTIVYTGVVIAIIHLLVTVSAILFHNARTVNDIRLYAGYFSDFEFYVLIILIFHEKFELNFSRKKLFYFMTLVGISGFMYLARTNFIQLAILALAMKGFLKINRTSLTVLASFIGIVVIGYSAILYINPKRNGPGVEALLYKIKIAPIEPFKTKIDVDDWKDFNDNYRSYENICTVQQVTAKGTKSVMIGEGIGSTVDLKREVPLGDMLMRYISILHNGYMTVFLKSGLLGIVIYLISIFLLFKQKESDIPMVENMNLMLVGTGVFLIFSSWVFMGVYNLIDNKSMLIGAFIFYREMCLKENANPSE
jgi:hypothetical protein